MCLFVCNRVNGFVDIHIYIPLYKRQLKHVKLYCPQRDHCSEVSL